MASNIDDTIPVNATTANADPLRANFVAAKEEIIALQGDVATLEGAAHAAVSLAGTPDYLTLTGQQITRNLIDVATDVTGDLPLSNLSPALGASQLLGRGSSGAGDWQPITLGTGLDMSGTTLSASGLGEGEGANLSVVNRTDTTLDIASDTGTDATIPAASVTDAGLMSAADKSKLDGVQSGAVSAGASGDAYAISHDSDVTAHTAGNIVNVPAGNLASTTVQAALNELDSEKSATGHNHDASYAATSHNHDASYSATGHNHDASYAATSHTHVATGISDSTAAGRTLLTAADAAAQRAALGVSALDVSGTPSAGQYARFTDTDTLEARTAAQTRADLDLEAGTDVQAYMASASQAEMEAGTESALRAMTPQRVAQAVVRPNAAVRLAYGHDEGTDTVASGGASQTVTLDGKVHYITLDAASCAITPSTPSGATAANALVLLKQDATGSRAVTWSGSPVQLGTQAMPSGAGKHGCWVLWTPNAGTTYFLTPAGVQS